MLRTIILLASIATFVSAADDPDWPTLERLFGQDSQSQAVKDFVSTNHLGEMTKGDSGSFWTKHQSYSLLYRGGRIETIVLKLAHWSNEGEMKDWRTYSQPLPAGLSSADGRKAVEMKLGPPANATNRSGTWVQAGLKLWIIFNADEMSLESIYISKSTEDR
jgi:hypothetical protein